MSLSERGDRAAAAGGLARLARTLREGTQRFVADRGLLLASALAFVFVLCLAPLILLSLSLVGFLLTSEQIIAYVLEAGNTLLPRYGREMGNLVGALLRERQVNGILGAAVLVAVTIELFALMRMVLNITFRVPRRGLVRGFAFDLIALTVLGLVTLVAAAAIAAALALRDLGRLVLPSAPAGLDAWARTPTLVLIYATFLTLLFLVYRTFPNTRVPTWAAARATVAVAILWEAARQVFSAYLTRFTPYGTLYGSFGAVVAILVWIYISATLFVWGACLAAAMTAGSATRAAAEPVERARATAWLARASAGLAGLGLVAVLTQNLAPVRVRVLHWTVDGVPLAAVLLFALAAGGLFMAALTGARRPPD